jgi:RHS repeat-associated protein
MINGYTPDGYQYAATYDGENRLISIDYTDSGSVVHNVQSRYDGNSFIGLIKKYEDSTLVDETRIVRDGFLTLQERGGDNNILRQYAWGQNKGAGIGGLLALYENEESYYYLYDGKGNVGAVIDSNQLVSAFYHYDTFGNLMQQSGTLSQPFQFSTKRYLANVGLNYYGYRFYNPSMGRWMNRDPLGEAGGINLYGFVQNNPVNAIDPWGLTQQDIDVAVKIIKETQNDLRFPKNVDPSMQSDKYAGEYQMLTDTIRLNENYLKELTDTQAADLLDTLIHETLHANDSAWKQFLDSFRDHPDIYNEADQRTKEILERFLRERKQDPCD